MLLNYHHATDRDLLSPSRRLLPTKTKTLSYLLEVLGGGTALETALEFRQGDPLDGDLLAGDLGALDNHALDVDLEGEDCVRGKSVRTMIINCCTISRLSCGTC